MKTGSIRLKIMLWVSSCLIALSLSIIGFTAVSTYRNTMQNSREQTGVSAGELANNVEYKFEKMRSDLNTIYILLSKTQCPLETLYLERDHVDTVLLSILKRDPAYSGVFTCWLPDAFDNRDEEYRNEPGYDDTGRFSRYWYRNIYGLIEVRPMEHHEKGEFASSHHMLTEEFQTTHYSKVIGGKNVTVISTIIPILVHDQQKGLVGIDYNSTYLKPALYNSYISNRGGDIYLFSDTGIVVCNTANNNNGKDCAEDYGKYLDYEKNMLEGDRFSVELKEKTLFFVPLDIPDSRPWWIVVSLSGSHAKSRALSLTAALLFLGTVFIIVSLIIVWTLSGYIAEPVKALAEDVNRMGSGDYSHPVHLIDKADEIGILSRAFEDMRLGILNRENMLKNSVREKEILLRELYHRTRNNMQIISSMLSLQLLHEDNEKICESYKKTQLKIELMALAHEKLYENEDLSNIQFDHYLSKLVKMITSNYLQVLRNVTITLQVESVTVLIDTAIPLGLVISEIIINSLKHAFGDHRKGEIRVQLRKRENGFIEVTIADDGVGVQEDFNYREVKTLGIKTIIGIVEQQLDGELEFEQADGVTWTIRFKDDLYDERVVDD